MNSHLREPLSVSVVIPFFNEIENLSTLASEVRSVMDHLAQSYEVLLVDDGSSDGTGSQISQLAATWPQCRPLLFKQNRGQAAALLDGMRAACGEVIVTLDGDGQNDPADIPLLLKRLEECDMVAGVRANRQDSPLRKKMSRVANSVRSRFLQDGVTDTGCAIKAFRREVVNAFIPIRTLYSFMPALAVAAGFRVREQSVNHRPRTAGISKYSLGIMLWRPLVDMIGIRWFNSRRIPSQQP